MSNHTPGPWYFNDDFNEHQVFSDQGAYNLIADVVSRGEDTEANARLIAAAPDLLIACEQMIAIFKAMEEQDARITNGHEWEGQSLKRALAIIYPDIPN